MRSKVLRIALAVVAVVAVNLLARLVVRFGFGGDGGPGRDPFLAALWSLVTAVVLLGGIGLWWTRQRRVPLVIGEVLLVVVVSTLIVTLVGPYVYGATSFDIGLLLRQIALHAVLLAVGGVAGVLIAVALGLDPTSRAWGAMAQGRTRARR